MKTRILLTLASVALLALGCNGTADGRLVGTDIPDIDNGNGNPDTQTDDGLAGPKLSINLQASPWMLSVGQELRLDISVTNSGDTDASSVMPSTPIQTGTGHATLKSTPNPTDLKAGDTQLFEFVYVATDSGSISFEVGADGTDLKHDRAVTAAPVSASVVVESAAILSVDALSVPSAAVVGKDFQLSMTVSNGGQSAAMAVAPGQLALTGSGKATLIDGPTPAMATIAQGGSQTFTFTYRPTQAGSLVFQGSASGIDGNSSEAVTADPLTSPSLDVDTPAALTAMMSIPSAIVSGQPFTATLVVHNSGTATAQGVLPSPLMPSVTTVSGTASATATVTPAAQDVPGGGTATFTWQFTASGTGAISISALAQGTDEATGQSVASALAHSNNGSVAAPGALTVVSVSAPNIINRGQTFNLTAVVKNTGGAAVNGISAVTAPVLSGGSAVTASNPSIASLAAGQSANLVWSYTENGTAAGQMSFTVTVRGVNSATSAQVTSPPTSSNLVVVVQPPSLLIESIAMPARISRGQSFNAVVSVRNTGGSTADNVIPSLTVNAGGMAAASTSSTQTPVSIMAGQKASFTYAYVENGAGTGTLQLQATASGTDTATGATLNATMLASPVATVESPAQLAISAFVIPATINRGTVGFALSLTVTNSGQASATNVIPMPNPPTRVITGGVIVSTTSTVTPVTVLGNSSQTFTWLYNESGTAAGTLAFSAAVQGLDGNSGAAINVAQRSTNVASVSTPMGCNGSMLYTGFGARSLDGDRLDNVVGTDRLRVKPYAMLVTEFARMLGATPTKINGQGTTFNAAPARWYIEQQLAATSLNTAFDAAFQGCITYTTGKTQFSANPTAATAQTQCQTMQHTFWQRVPTTAETTACANFATATINNDPTPSRRWAYVCASVLASTGFLTQ